MWIYVLEDEKGFRKSFEAPMLKTEIHLPVRKCTTQELYNCALGEIYEKKCISFYATQVDEGRRIAYFKQL